MCGRPSSATQPVINGSTYLVRSQALAPGEASREVATPPRQPGRAQRTRPDWRATTTTRPSRSRVAQRRERAARRMPPERGLAQNADSSPLLLLVDVPRSEVSRVKQCVWCACSAHSLEPGSHLEHSHVLEEVEEHSAWYANPFGNSHVLEEADELRWDAALLASWWHWAGLGKPRALEQQRRLLGKVLLVIRRCKSAPLATERSRAPNIWACIWQTHLSTTGRTVASGVRGPYGPVDGLETGGPRQNEVMLEGVIITGGSCGIHNAAASRWDACCMPVLSMLQAAC